MLKNQKILLISAFLFATTVVAPVVASEFVEDESAGKGKAAKFVKNTATYLPSNQLTVASGVEVVAESYADTITSGAVSALTSLGVELVHNETQTGSTVLSTIGNTLVDFSNPVVKFTAATIIKNTAHAANSALGNEESLTWKERFMNAGRTAGAVAVMHYTVPVVQSFAEEMVKTYVSTSLSGLANTVGIPLTLEMVNDAAPYFIKAGIVGGSVAVHRIANWFGQRFLEAKTATKTKKD